MGEENQVFSAAASAALGSGENRFYVYCLTDLKKGKVLYIGTGCGNRIFEFDHFDAPTAKAVSKCHKVGRFILGHHLSEYAARAAQQSLIAFVRSVGGKKLKNHADSPAWGTSAEEWERRFGFEPADADALNPDSLILAVKMPQTLNRNESAEERANRAGGVWTVAKDLVKKVKYLIGIDTDSGNAVVCAYAVAGFETVEAVKNGRPLNACRFVFAQDENVAETLGLQQKSLPGLRFANGSDKTYIRPKNTQTAADAV